MNRADTSFLKSEAQIKSAFTSLAKTMTFLDFYTDKPLKVRDGKGQLRPTVDAFCDVMAEKMTEQADDRDLVVMRHIFTLQDQ